MLKVQRLGGGGGSYPSIKVNTNPNTDVSFSIGGSLVKTITADENGIALFKVSKYGLWYVQTEDDMQEVDVVEVYETEMTGGKRLSKLVVGEKLMLGTTPFIVIAKNHTDFESGAITLAGEYADYSSAYGTQYDNHYDQNVRNYLLNTLLPTFNQTEQNAIIPTTFKAKWTTSTSSGYDTFTDKLFLLSTTQLGVDNDSNEGTAIPYFSSNTERIFKDRSGTGKTWWTRTGYLYSSNGLIYSIRATGEKGTLPQENQTNNKNFVRPICNLKPSTILYPEKDNSGYYHIKINNPTLEKMSVGSRVYIVDRPFIIKAKAHANYGADSITMISEGVVESSAFGQSGNYSTSYIKQRCQYYYDILSGQLKSYFLTTTRQIKENTGLVGSSEKFFVPTYSEYGGPQISGEPTNIGFNSNADRIVANSVVWTATANDAQDYCIDQNGAFTSLGATNVATFRMACNLKKDTPLTYNADGSYSVKRTLEKAGDLMVGEKVKLSGIPFIVIGNNHPDFDVECITLFAENILTISAYGASGNNHYNQTARSYLVNTLLPTLSQVEQNALVSTTFKAKYATSTSVQGYDEFTDKIFLLSSTQVGLENDTNEGSAFPCFTDNSRRIGYYNGEAKSWWLRTGYWNGSGAFTKNVHGSGSLNYISSHGPAGVRPACNVQSDTILNEKLDNGYYTIKGAPTTQELKDNALQMLGVEL